MTIMFEARRFGVAALACLLASTALDAKPASPPPNPQVAYAALGGQSNKLYVSDENGTNANTLFTSATAFRFDLAPRAQRQIAIVDGSLTNPQLQLLTYGSNGAGGFTTTSVVPLASARRGSNVSFSPDGSRIAYACCSNGNTEKLMVYDLGSNSTTEWATGAFFWDMTWFRSGASIAYVDDTEAHVYEVTSPGSAAQLIFSSRGSIYLDASHTNRDALVISYNDSAGNALTGLWQAPTTGDPSGHFINANLTNGTTSFNGDLNCDDSELAFLGPPNKTPTWYIRSLTSGLTSLFSRSSSIHWLQFWPTCS